MKMLTAQEAYADTEASVTQEDFDKIAKLIKKAAKQGFFAIAMPAEYLSSLAYGQKDSQGNYQNGLTFKGNQLSDRLRDEFGYVVKHDLDFLADPEPVQSVGNDKQIHRICWNAKNRNAVN